MQKRVQVFYSRLYPGKSETLLELDNSCVHMETDKNLSCSACSREETGRMGARGREFVRRRTNVVSCYGHTGPDEFGTVLDLVKFRCSHGESVYENFTGSTCSHKGTRRIQAKFVRSRVNVASQSCCQSDAVRQLAKDVGYSHRYMQI